ncbi:MAG: hypothetical protein IJ529_00160 [Alphaproteobacteria bacterium]|nr:hypothetical protein [Alphaproteobacteria bacterium]MBQ9235120.1 hypothetical protein [Alphaproteobacteria bacterium]
MLKSYVNRLNKSVDITIPAPTGGLNLRDNISSLAADEALQMDNYIPYDTKVALRRGYVDYVKTNTKFLTLSAYKSNNIQRFIGISQGQAYNLTSSAGIRVYDDVSFNNDRCQTVQYKNYLYFMNGSDTPKVFYIDDDGVEHFGDWGFAASGLNASSVVAGSVSKQFLWFVEKGRLRCWYAAAAGNISGELLCFDLSLISRFGGHLVAVCNWTIDGGNGMDDLTVFITSEGEVLVYSGINPNSADDWQLKGSYKISAPLGYRCTMPYQGDIVIITQDGYLPLSKVLSLSEAGSSSAAFSDKIRGLVLERAASGKNKEGWQSLTYTKGGYAIFNVPISQGYEQHVVNLLSGAWCRFTDIKSHCWVVYDDKIFFGSDYGVCQFDHGYSDNGVRIRGIVRQSYNNLGYDGLKKIQLLNPRTSSSTKYALRISTDMDFRQSQSGYLFNIGFSSTTPWNKVRWAPRSDSGQTKWQTFKGTIRSSWLANSATGYKAGIVFQTETRGNLIEWYDTGVRYERATGIM